MDRLRGMRSGNGPEDGGWRFRGFFGKIEGRGPGGHRLAMPSTDPTPGVKVEYFAADAPTRIRAAASFELGRAR